MSRVFLADLALLLLNVLWGYCYILIKQLLVEVSPFYLLTFRFFIAAVLLLPFQIRLLRQISIKEVLSYSACGIALAFGFILQTIGMTSTTPAKSGVITATLVVFVPFINYFWTGASLKKHIILGTILAFVGLYFISLDDLDDLAEINIGDFFLLAGAISFAFHIVLAEETLKKFPKPKPILLTQVQLFIVCILSFVPATFYAKFPVFLSDFVIFGILFLGILGSLVAYIIQMWAQKYSPAHHVGVILSTEAVFACLFSYLILGEQFTLLMWAGAILVLAGIFITQGFFSLSEKN